MENNIFVSKMKDNVIEFHINAKFYPLDAVTNASYVFIDRAFILLDGDPKSKIKICLKGKEKLSDKQLEILAGEFNNELLNQILRVQIAKNNKKLQEFIVGQALFGASPEQVSSGSCDKGDDELDKILERELKALEVEENRSNDKEDPMGVLTPWEKKGKKK